MGGENEGWRKEENGGRGKGMRVGGRTWRRNGREEMEGGRE